MVAQLIQIILKRLLALLLFLLLLGVVDVWDVNRSRDVCLDRGLRNCERLVKHAFLNKLLVAIDRVKVHGVRHWWIWLGCLLVFMMQELAT